MDYQLKEEADVEALQTAVRRGIRGADPPDVGARDWQPLGLALRAPDGALMGGLYGATMWGWLMVDGLWVAEELRGRSLGRRLLLAARGGSGRAWVSRCVAWAFGFQSRGFYERLGYTVFAELDDFPNGYTHYHLRKSFAPPAPAGRGSARDGG